MSSKRIVAKEWKRKRNQQRLIFKLSALAVCLLIVAGISFLVWDSWSRSFVMTFEGNRISTNEARYFHMGGIMGTPQEHAVDELATFLLLEQAAQRHGVALTAQEREEIAEEVEGTRGFLNMFGVNIDRLSDERMTDFLSQDLITERLADIYAAHIEVDEEELDNAFFSYTIFQRHEFVEMDLIVFEAATMDTAMAAFDELIATASIEEMEEIILRHTIFGEQALDVELDSLDIPGMEVQRLSLGQLAMDHTINPSIIMGLAGLQEGQVFEPVMIGESIVVFVAESVTEPPMDELEADFRSSFISDRRIEAFTDVVQEWRENADIQLNQRGINSI